MTASRWNQVVDALYDKAVALPGYRSITEPSFNETDVVVLDGPEYQLTGDTSDRFLLIGSALDADGEPQGRAGQSLATLGPGQSRDDRGSVICQVLVQVGSAELSLPGYTAQRDTFRVLRTAAFGVLSDLDTAIRSDVTLGVVAARMLARIGDLIIPRQYQTDRGQAVVSVQFTVDYDTRV